MLLSAIGRRVAIGATGTLVLCSLVLSAGRAGATDHTGTCTGTWTAAQNPHVLTGPCTVPALGSLVIESGAVVQPSGSVGSIGVSGTLDATSATFDRIQIDFASGSSGSLVSSSFAVANGYHAVSATSANVSVTGPDSTITVPQSGEGGGVVQYAGSATGTVSGTTFTTVGFTGLYIRVTGDAAPLITGNTFVDHTSFAQTHVQLSVAQTSTVGVTNNTFHCSGADVPIALVGNALAAPFTISGNLYPTGSGLGLHLSGTLGVSKSFASPEGLPLYFGVLVVESPATLTLPGSTTGVVFALTVNSGATLVVASGASLAGPLNSYGPVNVSGSVQATSAVFVRVIFTFAAGSSGSFTSSSFTVANGYHVLSATSASLNVTGPGSTITVPQGGDNNGVVQYHGTSTGTVSGTTFTAPGSVAVMIGVTGTAAPSITGNTFADNGGAAQTYVRLAVDATSTVSVTSNTFHCSGSDVPIALVGNSLAAPFTISGNLYPTGSGVGLQLSGSLGVSKSFTSPEALPLHLYALTVQSPATLTLPGSTTAEIYALTVASGATLVVASGASLAGAINSYGPVNVSGSVQATSAVFVRVIFTFSAGSSGSFTSSSFTVANGYHVLSATSASLNVTGPDSTITVPQGGDGSGVVQYHGTSTGTVSGTTFTASASAFVLIGVTGTAAPLITGNTFVDSASTAQTYVRLAVDATSTVSVTSNTFHCSGSDVPISLGGNSLAAPFAISGNLYPTGSGVGLQLTGNLGVSKSFTSPEGLPLYLLSLSVLSPATLTLPGSTTAVLYSLNVNSGATLVVASGASLTGPLNSYGSVSVSGSVQATSASFVRVPFIFTAGSSGSFTSSSFTVANGYYAIWATSASLSVTGPGSTITVPQGGDGSGVLQYHGTSTGTVSGTTFTASAAASLLIGVTGTAAPLITGNTFVDSASTAQTYVRLAVDATSTVSVTSNTFHCSGSDVPISLVGNALAAPYTISGNQYPSGTGFGLPLSGNLGGSTSFTSPEGLPLVFNALTIQAPATLTLPGSTTAVLYSLNVNSGATLVVASGASLTGPTNSYGPVSVSGSVQATSASFVRVPFIFTAGSSGSFTSSSFTVANGSYAIWATSASVSVTGPDSTITVPQGGDGSGVVQYHGTSTGTVSGTTFTASSSAALMIGVTGGASPAITGNDFVDNASATQTCVRLAVGATSTASVTGNTFRASGSDAPLELVGNALAVPLAISGNLYPTGSGAGNRASGSLGVSAWLRRIDGQATLLSLTILSGATATIDPASTPIVSLLTVAAGGVLMAPNGTRLSGNNSAASITVAGAMNATAGTLEQLTFYLNEAGNITFDGVTGTGLQFNVNAPGLLTLLNCDLAVTVNGIDFGNGRIDARNNRLRNSAGGNVFRFQAPSASGTIANNVIETQTTSTTIRFTSTPPASVTLDHNEFRLSGAHWFTQRAARYDALAAGAGHVCGVLASGEVRCAGTNTSGQAAPPPIVGTQLALGATHSCTLRADKTPTCWGSAGPHTLLPATPYRRIAAGNGFSCAIRQSDRGLECFGAIAAPPAGTYLELAAGREVGQEYACALGTDARVACWGSSSYGAATPPGLAFAEISAGDRHVCARLFDDTVTCWGNNASGQATPLAGGFVELASGSLHSCGRRADGTVGCWGANGSGQSTAPAQLFKDVTAGGTQTCGRRLDDGLVCWGGAAALATGLSSIGEVGVAVGADHACATTAGLGLGCWGQNGSNQATPPVQPAFVQAAAGSGFGCAAHGSSLFGSGETFGFGCWGSNASGKATANANARFNAALGLSHACALTVSGTAVCWGDDTFGQATPPPGTVFRALAAGTRHSCGITALGTIGCWGSNANGRTSPPGNTYQKIAAGSDHSCALRDDGAILCWGLNDLGQTAAPGGFFTDVAAGDVYSCGLKGDGHAQCWGSGADGRTTPPPGPFARLDSGTGRSCAVRTDGAIACWGASLGGSAAPNDLDLDAITDGGDNCPVHANFTQADGETDGTGNLCDNCPIVYARDQDDRDGDTVGDACDNCVSIVNQDQLDSDLNGFGDACEDGAVILRHYIPPPTPGPPPGWPTPPPPPAPGDEDYDVYVSCGTLAIRRVELAVVMPFGTLPENVDFGPGCTATTCAAATGLGETVDAASSKAVGPFLAGTQLPGTRADAVYFSLVGNPLTNGNLCEQFQEKPVARFRLQNSAPLPPLPNLSTEGLAPHGLVPLTDAFNRVMLPEEYGFVAQDLTPQLSISLQPALHDTTGRKWQVELDANLALSRVTFGLVAPQGTTTAQMRFTGCTTLSGTPATRRTCAANPVFGAYVAPATTSTVGPGASAAGLRGDTLYITLGGSLTSGGAPQLALNAADQPTLLGVVELDSTPVQPALTTDGIGVISIFPVAYADTNGMIVPPQAVQIAGAYNPPSDFDLDARSDDLDNCPYVANYDQRDRGGLVTTVPDGRGDRCQCGESTDDGAIFAADGGMIRELLAGIPVAQPALALDRCSVAGTPGCDVADVAVLRRSLELLLPFPVSACSTAVR